jgi:hypothetical protein
MSINLFLILHISIIILYDLKYYILLNITGREMAFFLIYDDVIGKVSKAAYKIVRYRPFTVK